MGLLEPIHSLAAAYVLAKQHLSTIFDILNSVGVGVVEVECRLSVGCQLLHHSFGMTTVYISKELEGNRSTHFGHSFSLTF